VQPATECTTSPSRSAIRREIVHLAWPVIGEQLLATLANMVDTALVGHLGALATAAVGFTQFPFWLMQGLFMGLGVGVNALVARFYGAGEHHRIPPATRAGFWLGAGLSALLGALIYGLAPWIIAAAGAEADVVPVGTHVLRLMVPGMVALFWMMVMTAALRATGDTRTSLVINTGINVVNLLLGYGLIYGAFGLPALGVAGAGYATTTARILGAGVLFAILLGRKEGARLEWATLAHIDWDLLGRILRVGYVAASERMLSTLMYILYAVIIAKLGTAVAAAQNITVAAEQISWMLGTGFSMAAAAMVGQRLGAGRPADAEAVAREAAWMASAILLVVGVLFIAVPGPYLALFTSDAGVIAHSVPALQVAGFTEWTVGLALTLNGALSGAGDTRPLFGIAIGGGIIRLSLAYLFVMQLGWGLPGAWFAAGLDWLGRSALIWLRFRSGQWKTVQV
jgi:putative MATE family efflux protein